MLFQRVITLVFSCCVWCWVARAATWEDQFKETETNGVRFRDYTGELWNRSRESGEYIREFSDVEVKNISLCLAAANISRVAVSWGAGCSVTRHYFVWCKTDSPDDRVLDPVMTAQIEHCFTVGKPYAAEVKFEYMLRAFGRYAMIQRGFDEMPPLESFCEFFGSECPTWWYEYVDSWDEMSHNGDIDEDDIDEDDIVLTDIEHVSSNHMTTTTVGIWSEQNDYPVRIAHPTVWHYGAMPAFYTRL